MNQYNIRVTNSTKIALALILMPMSVVTVTLLLAIKFPNEPDWVVGTAITVMLVLAMVLTLYTVKRLTPQAIFTLRDHAFNVDFVRKDFFTPSSFSMEINDVTNFFAEGKNGLYYLSFTSRVPPYKFNIEASSKSEKDLAAFTELMGKVARMIVDNNEKAGQPNDANATTITPHPHTITSVSMYESWWAKAISVFAILIFLLVISMMIFNPDKAPEPWRLSTIIIFGVPFIYKVWYHNYRKKKKE